MHYYTKNFYHIIYFVDVLAMLTSSNDLSESQISTTEDEQPPSRTSTTDVITTSNINECTSPVVQSQSGMFIYRVSVLVNIL